MTARTIPPGFVALLEILELEQPQVVTAAQLAAWAADVGTALPADVVVRRLRERGWLLDLTAKGVWEFAPAARAGAFGSGDPLIEVRATLARDPSAPYVVAAESAAFFLGLASRRPEPEVVGAPGGVRLPKALSGFRIVRWRPTTSPVRRDDLPVWAPATLLAFMASRPGGYHDWPNVREWLSQAARHVAISDVALELKGAPRSAWARMAYMLEVGGGSEVAQELFSQAPAGRGPYYLGDRKAGGRYSREYGVIDNVGLWVGSPDIAR
jgi:hypothetical protein